MMTSFAFVGQAAAPAVAASQINPAGPQGASGPAGASGSPGAPGVIQSIVGVSKTTITQADMTTIFTAVAAGLPTTLPSQAGVLWNNGGIIQIS